MLSIAILLFVIIVLLVTILKVLKIISIKIAEHPYPTYKDKDIITARPIGDNLENLRNDFFDMGVNFREMQQDLKEIKDILKNKP